MASGRITCDEFEEAASVRTPDPAVRAISDYGWSLYSDGEERLTGGKALSIEERRRVARCLLFLQAEQLHEWPVPP